MRRAAPGPQLSTGRIRVDAGKAIAKLRDYQLADQRAWVLEAIRAAVAANATRIELRGDMNDVWLSWDGEPWSDDVLPRLFDELVSPEAARETHHVRLLAAAVNSALGMDPGYVDVIAIRTDGATRVRYTPEILVAPSTELGESALRHVATEAIPRPDDAGPGMLVHVRRKLSDWRLFSGQPELAIAAQACRDLAVPLHLGDRVLQRSPDHDVVRIPLGEGLDGFIAIGDSHPLHTAAILEVAERGVLLASYPIELLGDANRGPVPIRVFVDAPRMPTNASRSQVRRDAHPIAAAERRAKQLVPELVAQLATLVEQGVERARDLALALIAAAAGGAQWHVDAPSLQGPLRELTKLPLVRNAVGTPRPLASHWRAEVHKDGKPFAAELAPWLETVLWAPAGDPTGRLLGNAQIDARGTRRFARWARKQLRAQQRFYAHEKREIRVLSSATPHVRAPLGVEVAGSCVPQEWFDGLSGEVCIYRDGSGGALAVLLEGRLLDRVEFESPLAFDVVIDSPRVTPGDRYRGVKRDAEYRCVERAMRAGIVRALEAHVLAKRGDAESDATLFRRGFGVIGELGVHVHGPLTAAPAYRTPDGRWLGLAVLAAESAIGIAPPGKQVAVPSQRVVIELDEPERRALARFVRGKLVPYRRQSVSDLRELTASLATRGGGALVVREPGLVAVLTPSAQARLRLHHLAAELDDRPHRWRWLPCVIAVDSDALVPDESWSALADDAGLRMRDYAAWELALVRAIASAIIGDPADEWVCPLPPDLDDELGLALCTAIVNHDPRELLGEDLVARLRAAKLLRVHGAAARCSMDELASTFPSAIPYVEHDGSGVAGFAPLVASAFVARAIGKLLEREVVVGTATLERYRRNAIREANLAELRRSPVQPMVLPGDIHAPVAGTLTRGVVGLTEGPFEIRVFVEGRPFARFHPADAALPLVAAVEIAASHCDETFQAVPGDIQRKIAIDVRAAIPALLAALATHAPHRLGEPGSVRTLLATIRITDQSILEQIAAAPAFATIQGGRVSIEEAAQPHLAVSVASWQGEWLGPEGEPPHALDGPIVFVPDPQHELARVVDKLHAGVTVDVTDEVKRLQSRRRIARGLVPQPRLSDTPAELKRTLESLGALGKELGIGEIALVEHGTSQVMLYESGNHVRTESLDVLPPVALAVELAEPRSLTEPIQQLAIALVKDVLASVKPSQLSPRLQQNLVRAGFARRIDREALITLPLWCDVITQLEDLGDVWVMCEPTPLEPLDPKRSVFFFERSTFELAREHDWKVIDATKELELDALARRNRARDEATSLELPTSAGVIAEVTLDGDGVTSPRGVVAVLLPTAAHSRGLVPHRHMHPFDRVEDPCRWPTLAVIDDARLAPDRTWSKPVQNVEWQAVVKDVRLASERALASIGDVPEHALAHLVINNHACADVAALRKAPKSAIRGVLWLTGAPGDAVSVKVSELQGARSFVPAHGLAIGGRLFVFAPDGLDVDLALEQLCGQVHARLARMLLKYDELDRDVVAAHVAHALYVRTLRATDARGIEFPCFSPRPLDARGLTSLFRRADGVTVIKPGVPPDPDPDVIEVVDDGSVLARTVITDLGERVRRQRTAPRPRPAPEAPPPVVPAPRPATKPTPPAKPEPPHPLRPLVAKLRSRLADLGIGGYRWTIVDRSDPMLSYRDEIEVAGDNVRLRALAAALAADSPFAPAGIDVVVAHVVTVLNVALSQITDASEAHALGVLLANPPSAGRPRSRRSS